jgi:hypothetical protein
MVNDDSGINDGNASVSYQYDPEHVMRDVNLSNPEELEAHLRVLDVRQRLRQRRRRMIRCFSVLVLIIVVLFLVRMGLTSTPTGEENSGVGTLGSASAAVLPSPPADLSSKCSTTSVSSPQGVRVCEEACEIAECCDVPEGFALSCMSANEAICQSYMRYCDILHETTGYVPPPQQVEDSNDTTQNENTPALPPAQLTLSQRIDLLCSEVVETSSTPGQDSCETLCAPSLCCFSDYCVVGPDIECSDFSGCYVLHADTENFDDDDAPALDGTPTRSSEIHAACFASGTITDASSNPQCTSLCAPGACCFEPNLDCVNVDCAIYAECNILYPSFLAISKTEVDDACTNHRDVGTASGEPTLCEEVCTLTVMQCCFHQNNKEGCDNVMQAPGTAFCNNYAACEVLGTSGSDLRDAHQSELEEACSNYQTRAKCISLCSAATCCFASSIAEECANVDASINCEDYNSCDVLYSA